MPQFQRVFQTRQWLIALIGLLLAIVTGKPAVGAGSEQTNPSKRVGKYGIELRIPTGGIFAEEPLDIEFRITDTSKNDPVLGAAGVVRATSLARITMPSMPGMPAQKPKIHTEGIPGDYGIECYFPHGGEYQIDLSITVPGEPKPFTVAFKVMVKDAESLKNRKPRPKPFLLEWSGPSTIRSGEPTPLKFTIRDVKTRVGIQSFDEAHTKLFHLIIVSKDLGWFAHEHPEPQPDGTFTLSQVFPAGGEYRLFADVAPRGAGSHVLVSPLKAQGASIAWDTQLKPTSLTTAADGIQAVLRPKDSPIPIGKGTDLVFVLTEASTGKAITDLEPYLGAFGHLMIIHQDGQTMVHSHPAEDDEGIRLAKGGVIVFSARFAKAGRYKAWGQFQRSGKVITLSFVFDVKGQ